MDRTQPHFQEFWQRAPAGPCRPAGSYILLTFDGQKNEAEASLERVQDLVLKNGALDCIILRDSARAADIWKVRGNRDAETWERELHAVMERACHRAYELGGRGLRGARHRRLQAAVFPPGNPSGKPDRHEPNQRHPVPPAHSERPKILYWRTRLCRACLSAPPASPTR